MIDRYYDHKIMSHADIRAELQGICGPHDIKFCFSDPKQTRAEVGKRKFIVDLEHVIGSFYGLFCVHHIEEVSCGQ